jgi:hypothetical protein
LSSRELPVGLSPAARPAAVVRSRRESLPIAARSRVAVSVSSAGCTAGAVIWRLL